MGEVYKHSPLRDGRSIRLIRLNPSADYFSTLCCELFETSLDQNPKFEALSYVWGEMSSGFGISCEEKQLAITANCEIALRHLHQSTQIRVLWVDAICIDQSSVDEKNVQVALMGEIYGKASRTLAWLSKGTKTGNAAFKHMSRIGFADRNKLTRGLFDSILLRRLQRESERTTGSLDTMCNLIGDLICDRYFTRMWTIQEIVLARKCVVCYGTSTMSWDDFGKAAITVSEISAHATLFRSKAKGFLTFWVLSRKKKSHESGIAGSGLLTMALTNSLDRVAKDPRDKIFALYSIFLSEGMQIPPPDYSKSVEQVYAEVAATAIKLEKSLLILSWVNNCTKLPHLPSWAPNWSNLNSPTPLLPPHGAMLFKSREPRFSEDDQVLHVCGKVFGKITSRSESYGRDLYSPSPRTAYSLSYFEPEELRKFRVLQDWTRLALRPSPNSMGITSIMAYFLTVGQDFVKLSHISKDSTQVYEIFVAWCHILVTDEPDAAHHMKVPPQMDDIPTNVPPPGISEAYANDPAYRILCKFYACERLNMAKTWSLHDAITGIAEFQALFATNNGFL